MFEKEAINHIRNSKARQFHLVADYTDEQIKHTYSDELKCWQSGAEFGYNKAIEWHDLRKDPDDLPKEKCDVLDENGNVLHYDSGYFYKEYIFCAKEYPIAWCQSPKFEK